MSPVIRRLMMVLSAALVVGLLFAPRPSYGVIWLDWADEFTSGNIRCEFISGSSGTCSGNHIWDDNESGEPPKWAYVGRQTPAGRANAKEKIMTQWYETVNACAAVTFNLARRRITPPPSVGSACSTGTQTFVGSVSYTKDSCVFANADWDISMRLKPVYDFTQETAPSGTNVGYRSTHTATDVNGNMNSASIYGCFKILWNN